jgi:pyridoxine 5-phosphate synthase
MVRLCVSLDPVADLRHARGGRAPEVVAAAHAALLGGADEVTLHLHEDRRAAGERDVYHVREAIEGRLNLAVPLVPALLDVALTAKPDHVVLVPDRFKGTAGQGGLDAAQHKEAVTAAIEKLHAAGVHVAVFVDPDERLLLAVDEAGADAVELNAARYGGASGEGVRVREHQALVRAAASAGQLGLRVEAGHGLDVRNVGRVAAIPEVEAIHAGFSIVAQALFVGLSAAVREMRDAIWRAREIRQRAEAD